MAGALLSGCRHTHLTNSALIRAAVLLLVGGIAAQYSRDMPAIEHSGLLLLCSAILLSLRRLRWAGWVVTGFALFQLSAGIALANRFDALFEGDSLLTEVAVVDYPVWRGDVVTLLVVPLDDHRLPSLSRVSWFQPPVEPRRGDRWRLELRLRRPRGTSNPDLFAVEQWLFRERIDATGYVVPGRRNRLLGKERGTHLQRARDRIVDRVDEIEAGDETRAVLAAISSGSRHRIADASWERYAATGTSHLVAISGLHVGLAALFGFLLARTVTVFVPGTANAQSAAVVAGVGSAILYAAISGFGVPARRAVVMLLAGVAAVLARRRIVPGNALAFAVLLVFLADPLAIMTPGFQLSFAAVAILIWKAHCYASPASGHLDGLVRRGAQLVVMQGALFFGLLPLVAAQFGRVSLSAPMVNLLVVPAFSLLTVPLALVGVLLGDLAELPMRLAARSADAVLAVINGFAALPWSSVATAKLTSAATCVLACTSLIAVLPRGWPARSTALIALLAVVLPQANAPRPGCVDLAVLDVGQGLSVIARTRSRTLLYDTGDSYRNGGSAADRVVLPYLGKSGVERIDWLVISHLDQDHAGGVQDVLAGMEVDRVFSAQRIAGVETYRCAQGQRWKTDDVEFRFLHPDRQHAGARNDGSCVLEIRAGKHRILLPGDIEWTAESALLRRQLLVSSAVVVMPHHGSLTSSSPAFVNQVQADIVIASAGYNNRWDLPRKRVLRRWQGSGASVYNTAEDGAVTLQVCDARGIRRLTAERRANARFWRD